MRRALLAIAMFSVAAPARAHVGMSVTRARFLQPSGPGFADGGTQVLPYSFATADASFTVRWVDGNVDPTGRFSFYYLDHQPASQLTTNDVLEIATPIPGASGDRSIWIACSCDGDAGVICPDAGSRVGLCDDEFVWDTSALSAGTFWVIAYNEDPPFRIYSTAEGPVRVAHAGAPLPPAVAVVLPDGIGAYDQSYRVQWIAVGQAPFRFDLFYGENTPTGVLAAPTALQSDVTPILNGDGSFSWDWDVSSLKNGLYYLRVKVSDATGQSSFSDSWLGLNVYHPLLSRDDLLRQPRDLSMKPPPPMNDGCEMGAGSPALLVPLLLIAALVLLARRRS
jgi:hypothetical protein